MRYARFAMAVGVVTGLTMASSCGGASSHEQEDPGVVALEGTLGNTFVQAGEAGEMLARVRVSTTPLAGSARPPLNLALVVDTSGSMEGEAIEDAREAAIAILDLLREDDRIAVVAFHSTTEVLLPSTVVEDDLDELREKVGRMEARGTTDMAGGLTAGLQEVMANLDPQGTNGVVLLGDGVPNDPNGITAMAQAAGERGIAITSMGLGLDYDETLMGDIATLSGGQFHYIEESSQVATVFRDEVLRMQRVFGHNAIVTLQPGPGVQIQSVIGQDVTNLGGAIQVNLGDLHEGEHRDLLVRATLQGRRAGSTVELMDVHLAFEDAIRQAGHLERRIFLGAKSTDSAEEIARGRNREIEMAAARMQTAEVTIEAIRTARAGDLEQARAMLDRAAARYREEYDFSTEEAERQTTTLRALSDSLPSVSGDVTVTTGSGGSGGALAEPEPAPAEMPADAPARVRRSHSDAMEALGH
jgi:Ca-activated chloride channel family protein